MAKRRVRKTAKTEPETKKPTAMDGIKTFCRREGRHAANGFKDGERVALEAPMSFLCGAATGLVTGFAERMVVAAATPIIALMRRPRGNSRCRHRKVATA